MLLQNRGVPIGCFIVMVLCSALGIGVMSTGTTDGQIEMVNPSGVFPERDLTFSQANLNNSQANLNNAQAYAVVVDADAGATKTVSSAAVNLAIATKTVAEAYDIYPPEQGIPLLPLLVIVMAVVFILFAVIGTVLGMKRQPPLSR